MMHAGWLTLSVLAVIWILWMVGRKLLGFEPRSRESEKEKRREISRTEREYGQPQDHNSDRWPR